MPVPHLAGSWQVITPPDSAQPWLVSKEFALEMLTGYGPCPLFSCWMVGTYGFGTVVGAGPEVGVAYPRQIALEIPGWSTMYCSACRMYSCRTMKPTCGLLKFGCAYWM